MDEIDRMRHGAKEKKEKKIKEKNTKSQFN